MQHSRLREPSVRRIVRFSAIPHNVILLPVGLLSTFSAETRSDYEVYYIIRAFSRLCGQLVYCACLKEATYIYRHCRHLVQVIFYCRRPDIGTLYVDIHIWLGACNHGSPRSSYDIFLFLVYIK